MERVNSDHLEMDGDDIYYWQEEAFTGIAFDLYPSGELCREVEIVDGRPDGYVREWYPTGEIKFEGYGHWGGGGSWSREWFPNGSLKRDSTSKNGFRIKETIWDEDGHIVSTYERPLSDGV